MTLVLSMNPFLDPEGVPPLPPCQPIWESERCTKTCLSIPAPPGSPGEQQVEEPHCRRVPDHVTMSRIAYFKRKLVDDEDPHLSFRAYCQTVAPALEERAHVLRLSLEKMRFIDDPEAFLRRSVLVNNLLQRLRAEILLQSTDWCFPPGPGLPTNPCILPPSINPAHQALHGAVPARLCLAPQAGPPFRKRFRLVRGGAGELRPECVQTCCCIYAAAAAAGHYLHLPFSMYEGALPTCPSNPHSSSLFQLGTSQSRLGLGLSIEDDDEEVEEEENEEQEEREEDEEEEEEGRQAGPSIDVVKEKQRLRNRARTLLAQRLVHNRTEIDNGMMDREEEEEVEEDEEDEEEEEEVAEGHSKWDSTFPERELHGMGFWHHRGHRQ